MVEYLQKHWVEIGLGWLTLQNVLKGVQDSLGALPKDAPPLTKVIAFMDGVGRYLFVGMRPVNVSDKVSK